jgi:hypothetical protein
MMYIDGNHRPAVILGPLWECVVGKLVSDWPHVFAAPAPRRPPADHLPLQAIRDLAEKVKPLFYRPHSSLY